MTVDDDSPGSSPERSRQPDAVGIPYPVPEGLLGEVIGSLGGCGEVSVEFAAAGGLSTEERVGWQVGVLVRLLPHGFHSLRGVDDRVVCRVREVLKLTEGAR